MSKLDILPTFAGPCSFIRASFGAIEKLQPGVVAVAGIPYEGVGSFRQGVREGPRSIREASLDFVYELQSSPSESLINVDTGEIIELPNPGKLTDLGDFKIHPGSVLQTCASLKAGMSEIVRHGSFPIMLGGDHYITYPLFQGFCDGVDSRHKSKVAYVQISSQFDLAEAHAYWGPYWHGTTAKRVLDSGLVAPRNMAWIGIHGLIPADEWQLAHSIDATVVTSHTLRERGVTAVAQQLRETVCSGCDCVYLSVDIGAIDGAEAPGRREITVGGLRAAELLELMRALANLNIRALDIVEVAPAWDPVGRTQRLAAEAVLSFIALKVLRK